MKGRWALKYDSLSCADDESIFSHTIGAGSDGQDEGRGVDILIAAPGHLSRGVLPVHAILGFNTKSGFLMIEGVDDDHKVTYLFENTPISLGKGQRHTLWQPTNFFYIAGLLCKVTYEPVNSAEVGIFRASVTHI